MTSSRLLQTDDGRLEMISGSYDRVLDGGGGWCWEKPHIDGL